MPKKKRARFNPKKEVSVMAWIENDQGSILLVRQAAGLKLWALPGGKVRRNESLERALKREVREESGLIVKAAVYLQIYDRPKRGAIAILFRVLVQRQAVRMHFAAEEIDDLGFFDHLPTNATPSAKFFWKSKGVPAPADELASRSRFRKSGTLSNNRGSRAGEVTGKHRRMRAHEGS
jgi:ADP-ribose pyrophosphatase YjhB (NUDIX family)